MAENQEVACWIPSQGTYLGCKAGSPRGKLRETTNWFFFSSLSPSLPLSLKTNKHPSDLSTLVSVSFSGKWRSWYKILSMLLCLKSGSQQLSGCTLGLSVRPCLLLTVSRSARGTHSQNSRGAVIWSQYCAVFSAKSAMDSNVFIDYNLNFVIKTI